MRLTDLGDYWRVRRLAANPWEVVRFRKARRPRGVLEVRLRDGKPIYLRSGFSDFHLFQRIFLQDEYRLGRLAGTQADCIVDLGANVGLFAARASAVARRVVAYEPVLRNFECLERNVARRPNVVAVREAVAGSPGRLRIHHPEEEGRSASYSSFLPGRSPRPGRFEEVGAVTLDDVFERHGITRCDLLKIDVEGQEYEILHGASASVLERTLRIHGEYHDVGGEDPRTRIGGLAALLRAGGFEVEVLAHARRPNHGKLFASRA